MIVLICIAILMLSIGCSGVQETGLLALSSNSVRFRKPVRTWKDFLEQNIVMQGFDYSCGAGALATLMRYYFQDNVSEKDILNDIIRNLEEGDIKNRKKEGLSLLDLKRFAERQGYLVAGVKLKFSALPKLKGPVLVYLETSEYKHFAILRGVKEDRVFIADPSRGNIRMSVEKFANEWPGIVLVLGKKGFGTPPEHPLAIQAISPLRNELSTARQGLYLVP